MAGTWERRSFWHFGHVHTCYVPSDISDAQWQLVMLSADDECDDWTQDELPFGSGPR